MPAAAAAAAEADGAVARAQPPPLAVAQPQAQLQPPAGVPGSLSHCPRCDSARVDCSVACLQRDREHRCGAEGAGRMTGDAGAPRLGL